MAYVLRDFRVQKCCSECGRPLETENTKAGICLGFLTVTHAGKSLRLSATHSRVLETLLRRFPDVAPRDYIFSRVWGLDSEVEDKTLDVVICSMRKKLKAIGLGIKTEWGIGYQLCKL